MRPAAVFFAAAWRQAGGSLLKHRIDKLYLRRPVADLAIRAAPEECRTGRARRHAHDYHYATRSLVALNVSHDGGEPWSTACLTKEWVRKALPLEGRELEAFHRACRSRPSCARW